MAFVDCTEQQIPRPKNRKRKRIYYCRKKKKHTVRNLYTVNPKGLMICKTKRGQTARRHDYKIFKDNHPNVPNDDNPLVLIPKERID